VRRTVEKLRLSVAYACRVYAAFGFRRHAAPSTFRPEVPALSGLRVFRAGRDHVVSYARAWRIRPVRDRRTERLKRDRGNCGKRTPFARTATGERKSIRD